MGTAQESLLKAAVEEGSKHARPATDKELTWGLALASAVAEQARKKAQIAANEKPPYEATQLAQDTQKQVTEALVAQRKTEAAESAKKAEALRMQAASVMQQVGRQQQQQHHQQQQPQQQQQQQPMLQQQQMLQLLQKQQMQQMQQQQQHF